MTSRSLFNLVLHKSVTEMKEVQTNKYLQWRFLEGNGKLITTDLMFFNGFPASANLVLLLYFKCKEVGKERALKYLVHD